MGLMLIHTIDTGSDLLWVPQVGCKSAGLFVKNCKAKTGLYNPTKSHTAEALHKPFDIEYGTGSAHGHYYKDHFAVCFSEFRSA
jgi:hypothetical protein